MIPKGSAAVALGAGLATVPLLFGTTFPGCSFLIVPIFLLTLLVVYEADTGAASNRWTLPSLLVIGGVLAIVSVLTGILNGLSDEPYSTPAYAALGWGMYLHPVSFSYAQYGRTLYLQSYDVYLPLLTFVQLPGVDYRWVSVLAWEGAIFLVRNDRRAVAGLSTPWIPLLAANGQNDFVPLFALTLALALPAVGRWRWPAEAFALALKQTANVVVVGYHLARREWLRAAAAVVITAAVLAPFFFLGPASVWCHVIVGNSGTSCTAQPWTFFVFKRNYWLYPTWAAVVFYVPIRDRLRRWMHGAPSGDAPADP